MENTTPTKELVKIPIELIMPNPDQPRHHISPESIQAMAESLKESGQWTSIKVRPLTGDEKARFTPVEYMIVGGERRWRGAKLAGLPALEADVLNLAPEQTYLAAVMDNQSRAMSWLEWNTVYERLYDDGNGLNQAKLAATFEVNQGTISRALKLMKVLNPASRELIYAQGIILGSVDDIPERPILALAGLEEPEKVQKALPVLLAGKTTEAEARKLVEWVKAGNDPANYGEKTALEGGSQKVKGEKAAREGGSQKVEKVKGGKDPLAGEGQKAAREGESQKVEKEKGLKVQTEGHGNGKEPLPTPPETRHPSRDSAASPAPLTGPSERPSGLALLLHPTQLVQGLAKNFKALSSILKSIGVAYLLKAVLTSPKHLPGFFHRLGIKNKPLAMLLSGLVVLVVANYLLGLARHLIP